MRDELAKIKAMGYVDPLNVDWLIAEVERLSVAAGILQKLAVAGDIASLAQSWTGALTETELAYLVAVTEGTETDQ